MLHEMLNEGFGIGPKSSDRAISSHQNAGWRTLCEGYIWFATGFIAGQKGHKFIPKSPLRRRLHEPANKLLCSAFKLTRGKAIFQGREADLEK